MATTDLKLNEPGLLPRPGPLGRLSRLGMGMLCLWYVVGLLLVSDSLLAADGNIRTVIWNGIFIGFVLVSYVVNIGFSRAWKKWPAVVSAAVLTIIAAAGFTTAGTIETDLLARSIWIWELYVFSHLGVAFTIAAVIATPGCEMRAFHDLYSRLTGIPAKEHNCPVGPLNSIDQWEHKRKPG